MKLINYLITLLISLSWSLAMAQWQDPDKQPQAAQTGAAGQQAAPASQTLRSGDVGVEARWFCDLELSYNDKGSGGNQDVMFFQPLLPSGYSMVSGYAQGNHHQSDGCVLGVRPLNNESSALLRPPSLWKQIWTDEGSGARMDGSIWHPETDHADYVCLGSIGKQGYNRPNLPYYSCVHQCLVETVPVTTFIWSDKGTGSEKDVSIYRLHNSNGFYALPSYNVPVSLRDLRRNPVCRF